MTSLGEIQQVSEGIYAYLQPDGSWYLNNTGFLTPPVTPARGAYPAPRNPPGPGPPKIGL
jgi:hypothetical protein